MLAVIGGLFWLFLWLTGWWFAGLVPAAGLVWLWWLGAPAHNLAYAAVLAAPCAFKFLLTAYDERHGLKIAR